MSFIDPESLCFDLLNCGLPQVLPPHLCGTYTHKPDLKLQQMTKALATSFRKMFEEKAHAILENDPI